MPELPEVEILVRHLAPLLKRKSIRAVRVHRVRVIAPTTTRKLQQVLTGANSSGLSVGENISCSVCNRERVVPR